MDQSKYTQEEEMSIVRQWVKTYSCDAQAAVLSKESFDSPEDYIKRLSLPDLFFVLYHFLCREQWFCTKDEFCLLIGRLIAEPLQNFNGPSVVRKPWEDFKKGKVPEVRAGEYQEICYYNRVCFIHLEIFTQPLIKAHQEAQKDRLGFVYKIPTVLESLVRNMNVWAAMTENPGYISNVEATFRQFLTKHRCNILNLMNQQTGSKYPVKDKKK